MKPKMTPVDRARAQAFVAQSAGTPFDTLAAKARIGIATLARYDLHTFTHDKADMYLLLGFGQKGLGLVLTMDSIGRYGLSAFRRAGFDSPPIEQASLTAIPNSDIGRRISDVLASLLAQNPELDV